MGWAARPVKSQVAAFPHRSCTGVHLQTRDTSTLDLHRILETVDQDRELLSTLIGLYRDDAPKLLAAMDASFERKDADQLMRAVHTLKGATTVFAADEAVGCAIEVEAAARDRDWDRAGRGYKTLRSLIFRVLDDLDRLAEPVRAGP